MGIVVAHRPSARIAGRVAYYAGRGQREERDLARGQQAAQAAAQEAMQRATLQAQERLAREQIEAREREAALNRERDFGLEVVRQRGRLLYGEAQTLAPARAYSAQQQQRILQIDNNMQEVEAADYLNPNEKEYALTQLRAQRFGIKPNPEPEPAPNIQSEAQNRVQYDRESGFVQVLHPDGKIELKPIPEADSGARIQDLAPLFKQGWEALTVEDTDPRGATTTTAPALEDVETYVRGLLEFRQSLADERRDADVGRRVAAQARQQGEMAEAEGQQAPPPEMAPSIQPLPDEFQGELATLSKEEILARIPEERKPQLRQAIAELMAQAQGATPEEVAHLQALVRDLLMTAAGGQ